MAPSKNKKIVFVGRLEKDTSILDFLKWFRSLVYGYKVDFCGDGELRGECEKYGVVHGFCDPEPFLEKADICVPGGYLAFIEAKRYGCEIMTFANNPLKKDYWREIRRIKKFSTWEEVADEYLDLYHCSQ